jgi:hypothetical protein
MKDSDFVSACYAQERESESAKLVPSTKGTEEEPEILATSRFSRGAHALFGIRVRELVNPLVR